MVNIEVAPQPVVQQPINPMSYIPFVPAQPQPIIQAPPMVGYTQPTPAPNMSVPVQPTPQAQVPTNLKDEFVFGEDFFLNDNEKNSYQSVEEFIMGGTNNMNNYQPFMLQQPMSYQQPVAVAPMYAPHNNQRPDMNSQKPVLDIQIRYGYEQLEQYTDEQLSEALITTALLDRPDISYNLTPTPYGFHELTLFKNGSVSAKFVVDTGILCGKGMPVLYGIIGSQFKNNSMIVPLGATKAVRECIFAAVDKTNAGVDALTELQFKSHMLPEDIYATVDMSVVSLPSDETNYHLFGKKIQAIDKVYPLNTRYRLYNYNSNDDFMLISDVLTKPYKPNISISNLSEELTIKGNTLHVIQRLNNKEFTVEIGEV